MKFRLRAQSEFQPRSWKENTIQRLSSQQKLTHAKAQLAFTGEFDGQGFAEYMMFYRYFEEANSSKSDATYIGMVRFQGSIGGKFGTCVWQELGTCENGHAHGDIKIIEGSGVGELEGISGRGVAQLSVSRAEINLDYTLDLGFMRHPLGA